MKNKTYNKKKVLVVFLAAVAVILGLIGRLCYLMILMQNITRKSGGAP